MKSLIKLLILIVVLEIILGYALYLRDSPRMTGNYISSTLHVLDKLIPDKKLKEKKGKFGAERRKLEEAECEEYINLNHELTIADMRYHRSSIKLQTSIDNLNTSDLEGRRRSSLVRNLISLFISFLIKFNVSPILIS